MKLFPRSFLDILDLIIFKKIINIIELKNIGEIVDLSKISFIKKIIDIKKLLNKKGVVVIIVKIILSAFINLYVNELSMSGTIKEVPNFNQIFDIIRKVLGTLYINISLYL